MKNEVAYKITHNKISINVSTLSCLGNIKTFKKPGQCEKYMLGFFWFENFVILVLGVCHLHIKKLCALCLI